MNIILVIIDTLRYDAIGVNGSDWITTPNIDRLAGRSRRFDRCFAASFPTIPHRTDVMTGRTGGPFHPWLPLRHDRVTFPRTLAEAGYATQLIHDTPHLVNGGHNFDWPFHAWTQIRGAEVDRPWITDTLGYPDNWQADPVFDGVEGDPLKVNLMATYLRANRNRKTLEDWNAAKLFAAAGDFVRDNAKRDNFVLWVDCFDPHEPWDAPREFMKKVVDEPGYDGRIDPRSFCVKTPADVPDKVVGRIRAAYAAKASWMDHCFGKLLDVMDETGLWETTAVVFTADHGTRLYERGLFGKGHPVLEEVAHVPLMVCAPGVGTGRSDLIVQPQDVFATVCALAGVTVPEGIDSHDVMALAGGGKDGPRNIALTGIRADSWGKQADGTLFVVYDAEWCLEFRLKPEDCVLTRLGSMDDVAAANPDVVRRLHAGALDEIERRGTDPALVTWLRSAGETDFPTGARPFDNWPPPAGYSAYFGRLCHD